MSEILRGAFERCAALRERTDAYRLIDADGTEIPALTVEAYGQYAVLVPYDEEALSEARRLADGLLDLGFLGVYLKAHLKSSSGAALSSGVRSGEGVPLCGQPAPDSFEVHEEQQRILIWLNEAQATGLFLDQRDNRARIRADAQGKRALNLFCYTGSFTVAAAMGGAVSTVSVDTSARALRRTGENLALNGAAPAAHRLLKDDARKWLGRAVRRAERFDWIILDPPSFSRMGSDSFSVAKDYATMARQSLELLAGGGQLLAVTNHRSTSADALIALLQHAATACRRKIASIELQPPPVDCRNAQGGSATKSVLLRVAQ